MHQWDAYRHVADWASVGLALLALFVSISPSISLIPCFIFFFFLLSDHNYQIDYFVALVCAGYVCVTIIHRTLTQSIGSLTCAQMLMQAIAHGVVRTPKESLHWKLTLGRKSLAALGNRTCISRVTVWCSISWATSHPWVRQHLSVTFPEGFVLKTDPLPLDSFPSEPDWPRAQGVGEVWLCHSHAHQRPEWPLHQGQTRWVPHLLLF